MSDSDSLPHTHHLRGDVVGIPDKCLGGQQKLSVLSRCHVPARLTSTPSVFTAWLAVVLPSKRPELRCDRAGASSGIDVPASQFPASSQLRLQKDCDLQAFEKRSVADTND